MCGYISEGVPYYYGPAASELYIYNENGERSGSGGGMAPGGQITWVNGYLQTLESVYGNLASPVVTNTPGDPQDALENWSSYNVINYTP